MTDPIKFLSIEEQCDLLSIKRSRLYEYAKTNDDFPKCFPHPMAPQRMVRAECELRAWMIKTYAEILEDRAS